MGLVIKIPNILELYLLEDLILPSQTESVPRTISFHEGRRLQRVHFGLQKNRSTFELLSSALIQKKKDRERRSKVLLSPLKACCFKLKVVRFTIL